MLTIRCTLLRDTFEGALPDSPRVAEWPPSWMRLYSALVSVADEGVDDGLLRALESLEPPEIFASTALRPPRRSAYVPTNDIKETRHSTLVARTNGERSWSRTVPRQPDVWYRWPAAELSSPLADRLQVLCRRVPYFGRSTSPAIVEAVDVEPAAELLLIPATAVRSGHRFERLATLRCPYPGALTALRDAYHRKAAGEAGDPWQVGVGVDYGAEVPAVPEVEVARGPYKMMVSFRLEGRRLDGRHAARLTYALRQAVMSRASRHLPTLHGHHDGDVLQCAFLALPFADAEHADGHILGMAVAIPDLPLDELRVIDEALPAAGEQMRVTAGPLGVLLLRRTAPLDAAAEPMGLRPSRWSKASRVWVTCLPMVLDRYVDRGGDWGAEVRRAVVHSGLPEPEAIQVSRAPLIPGGLDLRPTDTIRRASDRGVRPYRHVALRFAQPLAGPVVIGSMRHYGLGLCVPRDDA